MSCNILGKYISNINRDFIKYCEPKLAKYNLTLTTWRCMIVIDKTQNCSLKTIAESLNVDNALITRNIKKLKELNYILKNPRKEDSRYFQLELTSKGKEVLSKVDKFQGLWYKKITTGFNEEEIETLVKLFDKLCMNIK